MSKYYYERSSILDSKINITYHELFTKTDEELDAWIEEVRQYIIEDWDERGTPPMVGQSIEDIKKGFRKLREYNIRGFIEKDDDGNENIIKNFNKFANGVNQFFPTMLKTRIGDMGDVGLNSIYDRIRLVLENGNSKPQRTLFIDKRCTASVLKVDLCPNSRSRGE